MKTYVGISPDTRARTVFSSATEPTAESHGEQFSAVIGPFRTVRGAEFMRDYGANNPHCQCVADAERIAANLVLWGMNPVYGELPLKLAGGSRRELAAEQRRRAAEGWTGLKILPAGACYE